MIEMHLPFSVEQFYSVFESYNSAVWPAQIVLLGLAVAAIGLSHVRAGWGSKSTAAILAALWAWTGAVYHLSFFAGINPAARVFGGLFILQAALFLLAGLFRGSLLFGMRG